MTDTLPTPEDPRIRELRAVLDAVTDPELDESVVSLGFVSAIAVDDAARVSIGFRLPTYWCSANFAWIMAEDMRNAVSALPWVRDVSVILDEHMFAAEINDAINARDGSNRRTFADAFGAEADGASLDAVRDTFARKAFNSRQLALLEALLTDGRDPAAILSLPVAALPALAH
ncbi:MAG: iron-sulfur cluster assembly protein, partial [Gluconacetobacter diazotrophicus]|nr:iron-sulfur cluster assembly protein [Gluconacetobacter diazotrophicus]